ncbi:hypothetical protein DFH06DRAFT_1479772, partial [Mycena polygramma]
MCIHSFHHCGLWHPDFDTIFPQCKRRYTIESYIQSFFTIQHWSATTKTTVSSVKYCRTRGSNSYPFIIVRLWHPEFWNCGSLMKPEGEMQLADQTVRALVGTWRYDTLQTVSFPQDGRELPPKLVDILTLAELAKQQDCTRAGFPEVFFLALKTLFKGKIPRGVKKGSGDAAALAHLDEAKAAVIDAFPARRDRMQKHVFSCQYASSGSLSLRFFMEYHFIVVLY